MENGSRKKTSNCKAACLKIQRGIRSVTSAFDKALLKAPATHWIWDGVHPMPAGHELIAREWLKALINAIKIM